MISHQNKCIFVHIPKNAGQSTERVFLELAGLDWKRRAPLLLCNNKNPEIGPPRLGHLHAADYVRYSYISEELFKAYCKFTFVRDPFSRAVSMYRYLGYHPRRTFEQFVERDLAGPLWKKMYWFVGPQVDYVYDKEGACLVDIIGRFETLQEDFNKVCERIGLDPITVPHVNSSGKHHSGGLAGVLNMFYGLWRNSRGECGSDWRRFYTERAQSRIVDLYGEDFERFSYPEDVGSPAEL